MNFELLLREIYERYNPSKVDDIKSLLEKSRGYEEDLLSRICKKYGISYDEINAIVESENQKIKCKKRVVLSITSSLVIILIAVIVWGKFGKVDSVQLEASKLVEVNSEQRKPTSNTGNPTPKVVSHEVATPALDAARSDYEVVSERAYFFDKPDKATQRKAYLVKGENITVFNDDFSSKFLYVEFENARGQISKGWIQRSCLDYLETE